MEARGEGQGGDLGLVADLHQEEGDQGGEEDAEAAGVLLEVVGLVRDQRPSGHGEEAHSNDHLEPGPRQQGGQIVAGQRRQQMVGDGGAEDAGDDRPGLLETGGQEDGQKLGLVPDLRDGDHHGRDEQRFHGVVLAAVDAALAQAPEGGKRGPVTQSWRNITENSSRRL